jgi:hypothetical protein
MKYKFLLLALILIPFFSVEAQSPITLDYGETQLEVDLDPAFPEPETEFTATANDYGLPIQGSGMRWFINGELVTSAINQRTIKLTAGKIGQPTKIKLVIDYPGGGNLTKEKIVNPVFLDVIIEPQTRVPAFYKGRPLPSVDSTVNLTAIVNGNTIPPASLLYTWKLNGKVLEGGSIRGRNVITFAMPQGQYATINVDVRNATGEPIARRIFDIMKVYPDISFYESSGFYGLRQKAVEKEVLLIGNSITMRAEPYYLDLRTYNNPDFLEWSINGVTNANNVSNPYEVTLATEGGLSGKTNVDFHVRNTVQLLQGAQGGFGVSY